MEVTYKINGQQLWFKITAKSDKQFSINASTQNKEREWILEDIDDTIAKTITKGDYSLSVLTSIVEKYLIQCVADADVKVVISIQSEDLLVVLNINEKWATRTITLRLYATVNGKILRRDMKKLEEDLKKTQAALAETTDKLSKLLSEPKLMSSAIKNVNLNGGDQYNRKKVFRDVCELNLTKGFAWQVSYAVTYKCPVEFNVTIACQTGKDPWSEYAADVASHYRDKSMVATGTWVITECTADNFKVFLRLTSGMATISAAVLTAVPAKLS